MGVQKLVRFLVPMSHHTTPPAAEIPLVLTKDELAAILRIHPRTVERLVSSGQLRPGRPLGGQVRWLRDDLLAALGEPNPALRQGGQR